MSNYASMDKKENCALINLPRGQGSSVSYVDMQSKQESNGTESLDRSIPPATL